MFFLRVHSLDTDHTLKLEATEFTSATATTTPSNPNPNPKFRERIGEAHLFRSTSHSSLPNPSSRSTFLFIVAVPNYLSFDDFIRFCESRIDHVSELLFIRYYYCFEPELNLLHFVWLPRKLREREKKKKKKRKEIWFFFFFLNFYVLLGTMGWRIATVLWLGWRISQWLMDFIAILMGRSSHRAR